MRDWSGSTSSSRAAGAGPRMFTIAMASAATARSGSRTTNRCILAGRDLFDGDCRQQDSTAATKLLKRRRKCQSENNKYSFSISLGRSVAQDHSTVLRGGPQRWTGAAELRFSATAQKHGSIIYSADRSCRRVPFESSHLVLQPGAAATRASGTAQCCIAACSKCTAVAKFAWRCIIDVR